MPIFFFCRQLQFQSIHAPQLAYQIEKFDKLLGYPDKNSFSGQISYVVAISQFKAMARFHCQIQRLLYLIQASTPG